MSSSETHGSASLPRRLLWLRPLAAFAVFGIAAFVLHRELAHFNVGRMLREIRSISGAQLATAFGLAALSYWLLGFYDLLALRYVRKKVSYGRTLFTAFIAYAFGNNMTLAGFTGAAVRLRLYAGRGLTAVDVATVSGFCAVTALLGLGALAGLSLLIEPSETAAALRLHEAWTVLTGTLLLGIVVGYVLWASFGRSPFEIRGWALREPGAAIGLGQLALGIADFVSASAVLWVLLPAKAEIGFPAFAGLYAAAVAAGLLSYVPGGLGVFEAVIVLVLPDLPVEQLLGSLLAYRAVYYLAPLALGALLFLGEELRLKRAHLTKAQALASAYIAPLVPQVAAILTFVAGFVLLLSGATPSIDARITALRELLPLAILEVSHLVGSLVGLCLVVLAGALRRRVATAYHITLALLAAGIAASLLKGLDIEEAVLLAVVAAVLMLGRSAFYRPASLLAERFTPAWAISIVGVIAATIWIGMLAYRNVSYSDDLFWTFAFHGDAPRMLRASLLVSVVGAALLLFNLLRPARPEPAISTAEDLERARRVIDVSDHTFANAALMGDKRLLFSDDASAFVMYQVAGRSWVALGDPVGPTAAGDELVWRFRELSDRHGAWAVFYQASRERLGLYVDLGLAALKLGEEARVPLERFSLDGSSRADLRQSHRRALRDGATFEVVRAGCVQEIMPVLARISDGWLEDKSTAEKHFSVGAFVPDYVRRFDVAMVRRNGEPAAFANLWSTSTKRELSVDLMRFGPDAPRSAMDFLFIELMLWAKDQGYAWFNLGMAPLAGLEQHPLAPAWHRIGNFVFRHGEHFYNFEGLRHYKTKFLPVWEPKYLVAPAGIALPRILLDVSTLIAGGLKELFAK
ncbi:MAG TPA: bifunctional lysylphosphatidylglycerol flippase/synthetase MprF [Gammaproteobacteria bacterium]|nr:bifunctional lysylphosphatidylglycerol flippase/synthetase MprF [Gammaproteobacteria bacterium]